MNQEDYNFLERMAKVFKLDLNDNAKTTSRTASIAKNIQSEQKDQLCANMISEVVKVAAERVNNKGKQRTASVTTSSVKVDEVGLLKRFMSSGSRLFN